MSFTKFLFDDPLNTRAWYMKTAIEIANELGLDEKPAAVLAGMCMMQEAGVNDNDPPRERRIWCPANPTKEPSSTQYAHDSYSDDNRSCGVCQQQRGPQGQLWWGTVEDEMTPRRAIRTFMSRLPRGFHANDAWAANNFVQTVQQSGVPNAYAQWWGDSIGLYNQVKSGISIAVPPPPAANPVLQPGDVTRGPWAGDPTWLADVLRAEGVNVFETPGWLGHGHGDMGSLAGVICHHTGNSDSTWESIAYGRPDLAGPLAQVHLKRDGTAELVCVGVAWHAGTGYAPAIGRHNANGRCIGIEAQNNGNEGWSREQYTAYVKICAAFCRRIAVPAEGHVLSHKEWDQGDPPTAEGKWDPGMLDMPRFRADIQHQIDTYQPEGDDVPTVKQRSGSIYRDSNNIMPWEGTEMDFVMDAQVHEGRVESLAYQGIPGAVEQVKAVAEGRSPVNDSLSEADRDRARRIVANIATQNAG